MTESKTILLTGATGFVGSHLARRLVALNYEVHILVRPTSNQWRLDDVSPQIKKHSADLQNADELKKLMAAVRPAVIVHLATHSIFGAFPVDQNDNEIIKTNLSGFVNLVTAANEIDYRCLINTGSSSEYGLKSAPMTETDACQPINVYGITKLAASLYGQYMAQTKNKPIVTLRLFSPYGPYDDGKRLIPHVIKAAFLNQEINVSNPDIFRDYIYIDDIIDLYIKLIEFNNVESIKGEIFNVGSGRQISILGAVDKVIELTGNKNQVNWSKNERVVWEPKMWQADTSKTKKVFDWQPKNSLADGLNKTINWFKANMKYYE